MRMRWSKCIHIVPKAMSDRAKLGWKMSFLGKIETETEKMKKKKSTMLAGLSCSL